MNTGTAMAADIPPEWIEMVRGLLYDEGRAYRAGAARHTIEVQSIHDGLFRPLLLPAGGTVFASAEDRDQILHQLHVRPTLP